MGFAGNYNPDQEGAQLSQIQHEYWQGGHVTSAFGQTYGKNFGGWDSMSQEQKDQTFLKLYNSAYVQKATGINLATGQATNAPPRQPDITDELLQKTRTSFAQRLQVGNNRASSFGGT